MTTPINRRNFLKLASAAVAGTLVGGQTGLSARRSRRRNPGKPNFIVIFCDDMGYGDLGCYGSTKQRTPNVDRMAREGMRFTDFYVTSGVCTPSRSSLMTGCYPQRVGMNVSDRDECVLFPVAKKGLNPKEITVAEVLKGAGYATACIGKWHLGDQPQFLPTKQGFDYYYGIPYSNDMGQKQRKGNPPLPLLRDETVIEAPTDQNTITQRYTLEAVKFIKANRNRPFFLYLPHTMPHNPVHASKEFRGKSANDGYGDAVEEIDWSTEQILKAVVEIGADENTLVIFTSDNGAAKPFGGSNAPLSGYKGSTMEGGMREPCIMRWPGRIPAGTVCGEIATTMDILPTLAKLAGTSAPRDRKIDGKDIRALMMGEKGAKSPYEAFFYYDMDQLQAVRSGRWKLHLALKITKHHWGPPGPARQAALYDLKNDIGERKNVADEHPDVVKKLLSLAEKAREDLGDLGVKGSGQRTPGWTERPRPLVKAP